MCLLVLYDVEKISDRTWLTKLTVAKKTFSLSVVRSAHILVTHSAHFPGYFTAHNAQTRSQNQQERQWRSSPQERHGWTQQSTVLAVKPWRSLQLIEWVLSQQYSCWGRLCHEIQWQSDQTTIVSVATGDNNPPEQERTEWRDPPLGHNKRKD